MYNQCKNKLCKKSKRRAITDIQRELNLNLIMDGKVLQTHHKIKSFRLFNNYYTTNFKREGIYSYDDKSWRPVSYSFLWRCKMVMQGKVKNLGRRL